MSTTPAILFCQNYDEVPDGGITSEGGTPFTWDGGTLSDMPSSAINKALNEPCQTGADCQMNHQCIEVSTGATCEHNKCETGNALSANCDSCVQRICAIDASCCNGPCGPGEVLGPTGNCYFYDTTDADQPTARAACQARGAGWDLAAVNSATENSFLDDCRQSTPGLAWSIPSREPTNGPTATRSYTRTGTVGQPNGGTGGQPDQDCTEMRPSGVWHDRGCAQLRDSFCEGPSAAPSSCAHDPCETGASLNANCDPCVASICAARPSCCTTAWDSVCQSMVSSTCSITCQCNAGEVANGGNCYEFSSGTADWNSARATCQAKGTGWDLASINSSGENTFITGQIGTATWTGLNDITTEGTYEWANGDAVSYTNWEASQPNGGSEDCISILTDSFWYDRDCTQGYRYVCEGPGAILPKAWSQACVDAVATECDATCGAGSPPASSGTCQPWFPGQTDPTCTGYDLAVGVPCDGNVPICNHGTMPAPAGAEIYILPDGSGEYPKESPNLAGAGTCTTPAIIPPGACVSVTTCPGLTVASEIVVNPLTAATPLPECSTLDNWACSSLA